jgi:Rrf2 family nitric oxide-sensitive transcriptional repressor
MVECFDPAHNDCRLTGHCRLKGVFNQALQSYLQVLDRVTLADLVPNTGSGLPLP